MSNSPAYDPEIVARSILEEVIRLHPERLTVAELSLKIMGDPEDEREVETAGEAIQSLRASGLVRYRNDDRLVEPTQAVLRYVALMGSQP
jgi:hypothetical protein